MKNSTSIAKELILLSGPLIFAQMAHIALQVVDTLMLGQLGPIALATGSLGGAIIYNIAVFFVGFLSSTGPLLAQAQGENNLLLAKKIINNSLFFALMLSIPCLFLILSSPILLNYFHLTSVLVNSVDGFLKALAWGIPPWLIYFVLRDFVAVYKKTRIILYVSIFSIPLNALLNYILMYGKVGFPELGIAGVGLATSIVRWGMLLSLISYIFYSKDLRSHFKWGTHVEWTLILKMLRLGIPTGLMMGLEIGMFSISAILMAHFGVISLAAHQIALLSANAAFTIPLGISQATSILVGRAVGAKQHLLISQTTYTSIALGLLIAIFIAFIFYEFPLYITHLFLNISAMPDASVAILATSYLGLAAILQLLDSIQVIAIGSLRGMNDTFMPMLLGIVSYWMLGLSSGYYFSVKLGFQGIGLWYGLCVGIGVSVFLLFLRFHYLRQATYPHQYLSSAA